MVTFLSRQMNESQKEIKQLAIGLILINIAAFLLDGIPKLIIGGTGAVIVGYVIFKYLKRTFSLPP